MIIGSRAFLIEHLMKNFTDSQLIALDTLTEDNVSELEADLSLGRQLTSAERVNVLSAVVEHYDVNTGAGFNHIREQIASMSSSMNETQ